MKGIWKRVLAVILVLVVSVGAVDISVYAQVNMKTEGVYTETTQAVNEGEAITEETNGTVETVSENKADTLTEETGSEADALTEETGSEEAALTEETGNEEDTLTKEIGNKADTLTEETENKEGTSTVETENEGWNGVTTEALYEADNYRVIFTLSSYWDTGYNANIKLENIGDSTIQSWYLGFDYNNAITNIWNAKVHTSVENKYIIKNDGWNQDIAAGGSISFGISGNHAFKGFPKNYELIGESTEVKKEDYIIKYNVDSDWGSGFCASISITNNTDSALEDWVLEFDYERNITGIWNGVIDSHEGNHYVIKMPDIIAISLQARQYLLDLQVNKAIGKMSRVIMF